MDFRPHRCQASHRTPTAWLLAVASLALAGGFWLGQLRRSAIGSADPDSDSRSRRQIQGRGTNFRTAEDPYGVYLPTDRTLSRGIAQARERLDDKEYNEALAFLQQVLDRDEDSFLDDRPTPKATAA